MFFSVGRSSGQHVIRSAMTADDRPAAEPLSKTFQKPNRHRFIAILLLIHLLICLFVLAKNASHPKTSDRLVSSDSGHYIDIAREFCSGDFSMAYVKDRPHRQPLYPALLAIAMKIGGGNRFFLGLVNVLIDSASILLIYVFTLRLFEKRLVASVIALGLAANPFLDRQVTARLLTEPLHLFLTVCAIMTFLQYIHSRERKWLFACAGLAGLDYLTRPNGLFMAVTAIGTLGLSDVISHFAKGPARSPFHVWLFKTTANYAAAIAVFLVFSAPSWIPRLIYFGSPFHHGYLENYMWVDVYREGHVGESYASFTWHDYVAHHHLRDVISRIIHGLRNVYFRIPIMMERVPILFLLSIGGVFVAFRRASAEYRFLCLFLFLQLLPLVWTNLSNPTARVPYGSTLPFELFLAALFVAWLSTNFRVRAWFPNHFGTARWPASITNP
jgi:4-amino-4-deoxy-L-arabinose transferase-like glycosyltransferase